MDVIEWDADPNGILEKGRWEGVGTVSDVLGGSGRGDGIWGIRFSLGCLVRR